MPGASPTRAAASADETDTRDPQRGDARIDAVRGLPHATRRRRVADGVAGAQRGAVVDARTRRRRRAENCHDAGEQGQGPTGHPSSDAKPLAAGVNRPFGPIFRSRKAVRYARSDGDGRPRGGRARTQVRVDVDGRGGANVATGVLRARPPARAARGVRVVRPRARGRARETPRRRFAPPVARSARRSPSRCAPTASAATAPPSFRPPRRSRTSRSRRATSRCSSRTST